MPSAARPKSKMVMTFGWRRRLAISASRRKRSKNWGAAASDGLSVFTATGRCTEVWVARNTMPMPPWPSTLSIL
ncbi:hypothetical protein COSO111634_35950 [Corallococcus soli]